MSNIFDGLASIFVDTFGDDAAGIYTKRDGSWSGSVKLIYEAPAALSGMGSPVDDITIPTKFHAAIADLPIGYGQGDTLRFRGRDWTVKTPLPDGQGMVVLEMEGLRWRCTSGIRSESAVVAALKGRPTTGDNVFAGRTWPMPKELKAALLVYMEGGPRSSTPWAAATPAMAWRATSGW
jgi:hypothetical protein